MACSMGHGAACEACLSLFQLELLCMSPESFVRVSNPACIEMEPIVVILTVYDREGMCLAF
jgi:hypothetical protein